MRAECGRAAELHLKPVVLGDGDLFCLTKRVIIRAPQSEQAVCASSTSAPT
jgi:hypothetical protein